MLTIPAETETLAIRLARKTGRTPEGVIRHAVEATARDVGLLGRDLVDDEREAMIKAAHTIAERSATRPILDTRSEDEILGYDEHGIPR